MSSDKQRTSPLHLLIVGEGGPVRDRLVDLFPAGGDIRVTTVEAAAAIQMAKLCAPDVALLDFDLPGRYALYVAKSMLALPHPPRLVFLGETASADNVRLALEVGASGYWTKHAAWDQLASALRGVAADKPAFCPDARQYVISTRHGLRFQSATKTPVAPEPE